MEEVIKVRITGYYDYLFNKLGMSRQIVNQLIIDMLYNNEQGIFYNFIIDGEVV